MQSLTAAAWVLNLPCSAVAGVKTKVWGQPHSRGLLQRLGAVHSSSQVPSYVLWVFGDSEDIISSPTPPFSITNRLKAKPRHPAHFGTLALGVCPGNDFEDHTVHFPKTTWHHPCSTHQTTHLPVPVVFVSGQLSTEIQRWWGKSKTIVASGSKGELNVLIWPLSW